MDSYSDKRLDWNVLISSKVMSIKCDPIRHFLGSLKIIPKPDKQIISLSLGDPTLFGNLIPSEETTNAVIKSVKSNKNNGYLPVEGSESARNAVAKYYSTIDSQIEEKDVILTNGCSHALELCMTVLSYPGANILAPKPGFTIYETLSSLIDIDIKYYELLPNNNWQIDLNDLEAKIDSNTVAIIYNNPSNPCGSVFSRQHIKNILSVAEKKFVPIIADEIYQDMVFEGNHFYPIASLNSKVPVLSCGGTTKKFLIPGWRMGWVLIYDKHFRFGPKLRQGLKALAQCFKGPNSLIQGALPQILSDTPKRFFDKNTKFLKLNARLAFESFRRIPGLLPIMPFGAIYMMVKIDLIKFPEFETDIEFVKQLAMFEYVVCLPGSCFNYPGYMRIVLTAPTEIFKEALIRIENICQTYIE